MDFNQNQIQSLQFFHMDISKLVIILVILLPIGAESSSVTQELQSLGFEHYIRPQRPLQCSSFMPFTPLSLYPYICIDYNINLYLVENEDGKKGFEINLQPLGNWSLSELIISEDRNRIIIILEFIAGLEYYYFSSKTTLGYSQPLFLFQQSFVQFSNNLKYFIRQSKVYRLNDNGATELKESVEEKFCNYISSDGNILVCSSSHGIVKVYTFEGNNYQKFKQFKYKNYYYISSGLTDTNKLIIGFWSNKGRDVNNNFLAQRINLQDGTSQKIQFGNVIATRTSVIVSPNGRFAVLVYKNKNKNNEWLFQTRTGFIELSEDGKYTYLKNDDYYIKGQIKLIKEIDGKYLLTSDNGDVYAYNKCEAELYYNKDTKICQCQKPFQFDDKNKRCQCLEPYKLNSNQECICPKPFKLDSNKGCVCPETFVPSQDGKECVCPELFVLSQDGKECVCPEPFVLSQDGKECVCPEPFVASQDGKECVCPEPFVLSQDGKECVCPETFVPSQDGKECVCPEPFVASQDGKECVCPETSQDGKECVCPETFLLSYNGKECVCPQTFILDSNKKCACPNNYSLNEITNLCQPSCLPSLTKDACFKGCLPHKASTGILLSNGQCQCLDYHYWNQTQQMCLPHCNRALSLRVSQNIHMCQCRHPSKWNHILKDCRLDCIKDPYSTGQLESSEVCQCKPRANWNPSTLSCEVNCTSIRNSIQIQTDDQVEGCECVDTYQWDAKTLKCSPKCSEIFNSTGHLLSDDSCECKQGFYWDFNIENCIYLNCEVIHFSTGKKVGQECQCDEKFSWDKDLKICKINCSQFAGQPLFGASVQSIGFYSCQCAEKASWSIFTQQCTCLIGYQQEQNTEKPGQCVPTCTGVFDNGLNENADQCLCKENTSWDQIRSKCLPVCSKDKLSSGRYNEDESQCECEQNAQWQDNNSCGCIEDHIQNAENQCVKSPNIQSDDAQSFTGFRILRRQQRTEESEEAQQRLKIQALRKIDV